MRYLLVNETGEVLAELESLEQLVDQPGLRERLRRARGRLKLVRVEEHPGSVVSATSFVTASPLPQVLRERSDE